VKIIIEDETVKGSGSSSIVVTSDHVPGVGEEVLWSSRGFSYYGIVQHRSTDFSESEPNVVLYMYRVKKEPW
jgi:hypothetical protein